MKCKIIWINKKIPQVEAEMNEWLAQHPNIKIKFITQQPIWAFAIFYEE